MADFNKPDNTSLKTAVLDEIKARATDIAKLNKPTNPPTGCVAYNGGTDRIESYNGSAWANLPLNVNNADKLIGLTATVAELNKIDGFTGSYLDLNYAKDLRASGVTAAEFDKLDGFTGTATDLNYAKDLRATGVTTTEFDYLDGVTSSIQNQLNAKAPLTYPNIDNANLGKYITFVDYDEALDSQKGIRSYVRDGVWRLDKDVNQVEDIELRINGRTVVTEISSRALSSNPLSISGNTLTLNTGSGGSDSVDLNMLGVSQTWQTFTSPTRSVNTVYTNLTGQPIMVSCRPFGGNNSGTHYLEVGGVVADTINASSQYYQLKTLQAIVPAGSTYELVTGNTSIGAWSELR